MVAGWVVTRRGPMTEDVSTHPLLSPSSDPAASDLSQRRPSAPALAPALAILALALSTLQLAGCAFLRSASAPMTALAVTDAGSGCLVVVLPGLGDDPERLHDARLAQTARARGLACDFVFADAHLTYYREQTVAEREATDILDVASRRGYEEIWLVGISLGATGALETARARPALVDGVVLVAPFLAPGRRVVPALDGTLPPPPREHLLVHVTPRARWLADRASLGDIPVLVGFGSEDRFVEEHRRLASVLGSRRVVEIRGGHDWPTWTALWPRLVERVIEARARSPSPLSGAPGRGRPRA